MASTLNGFRVISLRLVIPYRGNWMADVDVDPDDVAQVVTSGPATLVIGTAPAPVTTLTGVIDPLASGSFVASARLRIVGGAGGWQKTTAAQHFHQGAGLSSTQVYGQVAAQVGETVVDLAPATLRPDYELDAGPAARVFGDVLWWVDPVTAKTTVSAAAPRPTAAPDASLQVLEWDPVRKLATVSSDAIVMPGTTLSDSRIGESPVTVRDVEQVFDGQSSRATLWCSTSAVSRLQAALTTLVRELGGTSGLKLRAYRVVQAGNDEGTWVLQAVDRGSSGQASPAPDLVPAPAWSGVAGASAKLPPSLPVIVARIDGDPTQPVLALYSLQILPLELTLDAQDALHLGPTVPKVDIAGGGSPVARLGDQVQSFLPPTLPIVGVMGGSPFTGTITVANPITGVITGGSSKATSG